MTNDPSPYRWRTVRVFLSSTFRDMHAERDYLVKYVFPAMREWCERFRLHLVDIDLRWGVTAAEAETGKALEICLEQIDGSRPFFLGLLGNRYGWVPGPGAVPDTVQRNYGLQHREPGCSITHLEIEHGVLESLRWESGSATRAHFYFRDEASLPGRQEPDGWTPEQRSHYRRTFFEDSPEINARLQALKAAVRRAFDSLGPGVAEQHLFTYCPSFDPRTPNPEDPALMGRFTPESLRQLGERIQVDLRRAIAAEFAARIAALDNGGPLPGGAAERDYHDAFAEMRTRVFVPRTKVMSKLREFVAAPKGGILAVGGRTGSGKSALIAALYRDLQANVGIQVIGHFVGASPRSTSVPSLLLRLCEEIRTGQKLNDEYIPPEPEQLPEVFRRLLARAGGRIVILIDGLNQLDSVTGDAGLKWFPSAVPDNITVVASALEGPVWQALQSRANATLEVPPLEPGEQMQMVRSIPSVFAKTLEEQHVRTLAAKPETANPLYLRVALEELRVFGSFERLGEYIRRLPSDVPALFAQVLDRLERDNQDCPGLVQRLFSLLACSRSGLTGRELSELMGECDQGQRHQLVLRAVRDYLQPRGELIDFFHQAFAKAVREKYLPEGAAQWHRTLAEYFNGQPLSTGAGRWNTHKLLEQPYQECLAGTPTFERTLFNLDFVDAKCRAGLRHELMEDYIRAERHLPELASGRTAGQQRLEKLDAYMQALMAYAAEAADGGASRGVLDRLFRRGSKPVPPEAPPLASLEDAADGSTSGTAAELRAWSRFVGDNLARFGDGQSTVQIAYNSGSQGPVADAAAAALRERADGAPWIRRTTRPAPVLRPAFAKRLQRRTASTWERDSFFGLALSPDGRVALSSMNFDALIWDIATLQCTQVIKGLGDAFSMRADGKAVVGAALGSLRIFKVDTAECICEVATGASRNAGSLRGLAATPDCGIVLTTQQKGDYWLPQLWDMQRAKQIGELGACEFLAQLWLSADASTALIGTMFKWSVWDTRTATCRCRFDANFGTPLVLSPDGSRCTTLGGGKVRVWDLTSGTLLSETVGEQNLRCHAATTNGDRIVSGTLEGAICVWDVARCARVRTFQDPAGSPITYVATTADGSHALAIAHNEDSLRWVDLSGEDEPPPAAPCEDFHVQPRTSGTIIRVGQGTRVTEIAPETGALLRVLSCEAMEPDTACRGMAVADSGSLVVWAGGRELCAWDGATGAPIATAEIPETQSAAGDWRYLLAFTADESRVVLDNYTVAHDGPRMTLLQWDPRSGEPLSPSGTIRAAAAGLQLTASGRYAASANLDGTFTVWDLAGKSIVRTCQAHPGSCQAVAISPDGSMAATFANRDSDKTVKLWDLEEGKLLHSLDGHGWGTWKVFFSRDGRSLWGEGSTRVLRWSVRDGAPNGSLEHSGGTRGSSGDDSVILEADGDRLNLLDCSTGNVIAHYRTAGQPIVTVRAILPWIAIRTSSGRLEILYAENLKLGPAIVTASRRWLFTEPGTAATSAARWLLRRPALDGRLEAQPTFLCPGCGRRQAVPAPVLDAISAIAGEAGLRACDSPCRKLPDQAWEEARLLHRCPGCALAIRFNPFVARN